MPSVFVKAISYLADQLSTVLILKRWTTVNTGGQAYEQAANPIN